jgi:uncharacterized protein YjbI with pentapeptide repeats
MLIKNLTPFLVAARGTSLRPPKPAMSFVVRATYAIADDGTLTPVATSDARPLSAETYREEDDDRVGGAVMPSDFADYKTRAEVLLTGSCHAPQAAGGAGGETVTECAVSVQVGAWSKALRVTGRRVWGGAPHPFVSMPLDWEHAYGGPKFAANPSGLGFDSDEMPTVTLGRDARLSRGDTNVAPASFGPINPRWPQRVGKLGEDYGEGYRKTRAPYFAADMDPTYFLESSPDQWLAGYLTGDESFALHNLHPRASSLVAKLPGTRARVFYRDDARAFHELSVQLDTLLFDMDRSRVELSWRGVVDVREEDLADIATLLVASEPLAEPKLPVGHYEAILRAHEADPVGASKLPPIGVGDSPEVDATTPSALLDAKLGPAQPAELREIAPLLDGAIAHAAAQDPRVKEAFAERVQETKQGATREAPPARVSRPGARPYLGLRRHVRDTIERASEARAKALEKGVKPEQLGKLMTLEELATDPRWAELDASYTPPEPLSTDAPGPGANLVDRDLRGADLRGVDLSGANLEGALLTGAQLESAVLVGARLYGATLYRADLTGARLHRADLSRANLAHAVLLGAKLDEANLTEAFFEDAVLEGASLVGAEGAYAIFTRAKLANANLRGAKLPNVEMDDADLPAARLDGADLSRGRLKASRCAGAHFSGANLTKTSFEGAVLDDARLFDVRADGLVLASASAKRAIFAFSRMRHAFMNQLDAIGADFHGADLRDARAHRANLGAAKLTSANLFGADLWKSKLEGTKLTKSNLFEAKLVQVDLSTCDLSGANLKKCILEAR